MVAGLQLDDTRPSFIYLSCEYVKTTHKTINKEHVMEIVDTFGAEQHKKKKKYTQHLSPLASFYSAQSFPFLISRCPFVALVCYIISLLCCFLPLRRSFSTSSSSPSSSLNSLVSP